MIEPVYARAADVPMPCGWRARSPTPVIWAGAPIWSI